ncbi:MAG: serine hydrolase [Actinomycetota bacterium]|nr:serine hydrolase [Actinomycetota bacterium]
MSSTPGGVAPCSDAAPEESPRHTRQDALLDLIRSVAVVRVVLWHTWSWAWLSWIPAMPAMFFTSGALLEGSLERRGWWSTLRQRARRLLIPYWTYAAACWIAMLATGWRPGAAEAAAWLVPLADPVGSADLAGLWVPLWYVRAYLWFVIGAGVLRVLHRRLGWVAVLVAMAAGTFVWWWGRDHSVPMAVGDAAAYAPFVLAGMLYGAGRRLPGRAALVLAGASSAVAALLVWQRLGPTDGVVNRSYLLTMVVGASGLALVLAWRVPLLAMTARGGSFIRTLNSRALSIYLWQGFGLVAANRLVEGRVGSAALRIPLSLLVVALVIAAAVTMFGGIEDVAARRSPRRVLHRAWAVPGVALVAAALVLPLPLGASPHVPLSGRAVVERAARVEADLSGEAAEDVPAAIVAGVAAQQVLDDWVAEHRDLLATVGTRWVDVALVDGDGELQHALWSDDGAREPDGLAWWSMSKAVTTTWFARLIDEGVVALDDPLGRWVPEVPRSDDMTLEQLARHSAGIPEGLSRHIFLANPTEEIQEFVDRGELAYEPGEGYGYSRIGYYLLALALERASGVPYTDAVRDMAERAGVHIGTDEDPAGPVTDPDGHGYRGGAWSSGGLVSELDDAARFVQWLFAEGVDDEGLERMTSFSSDPDQSYYGLGLVPLCPCSTEGDLLRSERFGLDTVPGLFGVDASSRAAVVIRPDSWWIDEAPVDEFYDLQQRLLDSVAPTVP